MKYLTSSKKTKSFQSTTTTTPTTTTRTPKPAATTTTTTTKLKTSKTSPAAAAGKRQGYSAGELRRLFRTLSSATRWASLRGSVSVLVECLRRIAEVVIWGDQHDTVIFTVFRQEDGLQRLAHVLRKKSHRRGPVAVQLLQTFAMLVQNIREKSSLMYLLNHEATRHIISTEFDFEDEEVLGYYVSFVRSIAFKLNESTVISFTKRSAHKKDGVSMPLFTEAAKFVNSPERMVRSAARTLTLTIMGLKNDTINEFLVSDENRGFFKSQVDDLHRKIDELDRLRKLNDPDDKHTLTQMNHVSTDIEDVICYMNDIYSIGSKEVQIELANVLWDEMLGHYLIFPLFEAMSKQLSDRRSQDHMSEEGMPLLRLPKVETLMNIASEWIPLKETDFHRTIFTTFIASTMNVLLRRSDFMYSRVIMQLINQAFRELERTVQERLVPLVNVDLETLDLTDDRDWKIEATSLDKRRKLGVGSTLGLMEFAEHIGWRVVLDVLKVLFQKTKCEKYRPSPLLVALEKNPKTIVKGNRMIPSTRSAWNPIKLASSRQCIHRPANSLTHIRPPSKWRKRTGSF